VSATPEPLDPLAALSCSLPEGEAGRRRAEVGALFARAELRTETEDGAELEYPGDDATARALLDFVLFERRCCAALTYELRFVPDHTRLRLRLAGPPELRQAVRAWAGLASDEPR
jgi:hypothetical protein